jgi:hypothetical protein
MKRMLLMLSLTQVAALSASSVSAQARSAYIFRNVRIWDFRSDNLRVGEGLVVGNKIEAVSGTRIAKPSDLKVIAIDGGGRVLTPGFIDWHVHMTSVLPPLERASNGLLPPRSYLVGYLRWHAGSDSGFFLPPSDNHSNSLQFAGRQLLPWDSFRLARDPGLTVESIEKWAHLRRG